MVVADGVAGVSVSFLDYLDHACEEAVHFDDCGGVSGWNARGCGWIETYVDVRAIPLTRRSWAVRQESGSCLSLSILRIFH